MNHHDPLPEMVERIFSGITRDTLRPEARNCLATDLAGLGDVGEPAARPTILDTADINECYHDHCQTRLVARLDARDEEIAWCPSCRTVVDPSNMIRPQDPDDQPRRTLNSTLSSLARNPISGVTS